MTGAGPYWNEDAQSWEYGSEGDGPVAATPPPGESSRTPAPRRPGPRPRATTRPGGRVLRAAALVLIVLMAVCAVAMTVLLLKPSDDGKSDDPAAPVAPAGYRMIHERGSYRTAVPKGWNRQVFDSDRTDYISSDGGRNVSVTVVTDSTTVEEYFDAVQAWPGAGVLAEPEPVAMKQISGQRMEYWYESKGSSVYLVDIRFKASDGKIYGVTAQGDNIDALRPVAETALRYFCPPGPACRVPH